MLQIDDNAHFGNLHDLGYAHGHQRYSNYEAFKKDLIAAATKSQRLNFVAVTNNSQEVERKYLDEAGFDRHVLTSNLIAHTIQKRHLLDDKALRAAKKAEEERIAALEKRPRNKDGRLLNKDGSIKRNPYEYFVGDRIRFHYQHRLVEGTIRSIEGTGENAILKTRLRSLEAWRHPEILKRMV